nr:MAG TPA: hypothetical protein [Caudoviricetes sp.]
MKFLTVEMDNFIKERVLYEVKVNKLSPADAHDKANKALKSLILEQYGAETKAIYIKDYGLKPDVALQVAVSDCKIKIETYFDTKAPKVGKQSDEVVWTNGFHDGHVGSKNKRYHFIKVDAQLLESYKSFDVLTSLDLKQLFCIKAGCNHLSGRLNQLNRYHGFPPSTGKKNHVNIYNRAQVYAWINSHKELIQTVNDELTKE